LTLSIINPLSRHYSSPETQHSQMNEWMNERKFISDHADLYTKREKNYQTMPIVREFVTGGFKMRKNSRILTIFKMRKNS